jgi:hypothetical protein
MNASPRSPMVILVACVAASFAVSALTHGFQPEVQPDTESYRSFDWSSATAVLSNMRTIAYPVCLRVMDVFSRYPQAIPLVQWLAWVAAAFVLYRGLVQVGYRAHVAAAAAGVVLLGHGPLTLAPTVLADSLAGSLSVAAAGCCLGVLSPASPRRWWIGLVVTTLLAYHTRPAYLFLIPLWPCVQLLLDRCLMRRGWLLVGRRCAALGAATALPFLAYCTLRWVVVGHFGLVSFGGLNLIGVVGQFLEADDAAALPADLQPVAQKMLDRRDELPEYEPPTSYAAMERQFNPTVWTLAAPAAEESVGEDSLAVNGLVSRLARELLERHPREYTRWLVWNAKHACLELAQIVLLDRGTLLILALSLLGQLRSLLRPAGLACVGDGPPTDTRRIELHALFWLAIGFAAAKTLLVLLVEPTIGRYMISAGPLLPPVLAVLVLHYFDYLNQPVTNASR